MPKKYPPLTPDEVIQILIACGFDNIRTESTHHHFEGTTHGKRRLVTVDVGKGQFGIDLLKTMIHQSGLGRDEFYRSTKRTARKINKKCRL